MKTFIDNKTGKRYSIENGIFKEIAVPKEQPGSRGKKDKSTGGSGTAPGRPSDDELNKMRDAEDIKDIDDEEARANIKKILDNPQSTLDKMHGEKIDVLGREKKDAKDAEQAKAKRLARITGLTGDLATLKYSMQRVIRNQISEFEVQSYGAYNRRYADTDVLKPGWTIDERRSIPRINVYIDMSGSFGDSDIKATESVIAQLTKWEKQKLIAINVFYFGGRTQPIVQNPNQVHDRGTSGQAIQQHILKTRPQNVLICTDSDITDLTNVITVKGGVWMMFRGGEVSKNLENCIKGRITNFYAAY